MYNIKFKEEYTYVSICDIDFKVLVDFDYDENKELYSLTYDNHDYPGSVEFLISFAKSLDVEVWDKEIKSFMLDYIKSQVECFMEDEDYNNWTVGVVEDGWELKNKKTNRSVIWKIHDLEDDCEIIQNEMFKFLNLQQTK